MPVITEEYDELGSGRLLAEITCPNCWHRFPPDQLLFIARHEALIGDDVAGEDAYQRFLPTRFDVTGDAIDPRGMTCQQLACPRCHLEITRPAVEMMPYFFSIAGAPASGKSYLLATMTWQLRNQLPQFNLIFSESDPAANHELQQYEEMLFLSPDPDKPVEIRKTETQGTQLYQQVTLDSQPQTLPRPFQFTIAPGPKWQPVGRHRPDFDPYRLLVMYDNAGEHFLPGADTTSTPVTLHLSKAGVIFFVFDPTQDPRFRSRCNSKDPQLKFGLRPDSEMALLRQESILTELAARVRRYKGLGHTDLHKRPLVIILAKADIWIDLIGRTVEHEPVEPPAGSGQSASLNLGKIKDMSDACGKLMRELCPEISAVAEGFAKHVLYVPVSSLGASPELVGQEGKRFYGIRPRLIQPHWVTVPMLWALATGLPGLIPTVK